MAVVFLVVIGYAIYRVWLAKELGYREPFWGWFLVVLFALFCVSLGWTLLTYE